MDITNNKGIYNNANTNSDKTNKNNVNWHHWCRLCAKDSPDNIKVYTKNDSQMWNSVLATSIGRYFWINIKMDDELSNMLCTECHLLIESLNGVTERIQKVQTMMAALQKTNSMDLREARVKYGVLEENWEHFMKPLTMAANVDDDSVLIYTNDDEQEAREDEDTFEKDDLDVEEYLTGDSDNETAKKLPDQSDQPPMVEIMQWKSEYENVPAGEFQKWEEFTVQTIDSEFLDAGPDNKCLEEKSLPSTSTDENEDTLKDTQIDDAPLQNIYSCPICKQNFNSFAIYTTHMRDDHNIDASDLPDLECKRCNRTFSTENQLMCHYRSHLKNKNKQPTPCAKCSKKFPTQASMQKHYQRVHENLKLYVCDCCGKALKTLGALNEHKLVHTDECPFECPVCQRRFKNKARLKIHSETHGSNSYICNICGLKLNTRRTFNTHKLVHSEEKQYKCNVCEAAFKRSKSLKSHLILHTGLRPYICNFCNKSFSNGPNCRAHKRKIHSEELAAEESKGLKVQTKMPLLNELRAVAKECVMPRKINRNKGLSDKMRVLLMAAEQREKEGEDEEEDELAENLIMELNEDDENYIEVAIEDEDDEEEEDESEEIICEFVDGV